MVTQDRKGGQRSGTTDLGSVVRRLYEAFAAWDMGAVAGLLGDDVVFHVPGTGANAGVHRACRGRASRRRLLRRRLLRARSSGLTL